MDVFVDDHQVDTGISGDHTVEDAVRYVQASVCAPGRIVVSLRCDGQSVPANGMAPALAKHSSTVDRLDVITGTRQALVVDAMNQAAAALENTEDQCRQVAELLVEGSTAEGIKILGQCLGVWQQVYSAVTQSLQMLELEPEELTVADEPLVDLICRPKDVLLQVKEALESQDHVLLADIMQYEFDSVIHQWRDVVGLLHDQAVALEERGTDCLAERDSAPPV
ncbi:MAG: hypothetical protein ACE5HE_03020 [Phycisphaerae bacterium]